MAEAVATPKKGTIPRGTYDAQLTGVSVVKRKDDKRYSLRVLVRTVGQGRDLIVWRGPADTPEKLDAEREQLEATMAAGEIVAVKVWHNAKLGQQVAFAPSTSNGNGHVVGAIAKQVIEDVEAAAEAAHAAHERVLQGLRATRLALTVIAQGCYELQQSQGWRALGYETLNEYLAMPEVTLSRPEFFRAAAIWKTYVLTGGVDPVALQESSDTKLEVPLAAIGKGLVTVEEAVADSETLTRAEMRIKYAGLLGGDEAEAKAERAESRRRDVEVTDEMVDRGIHAIRLIDAGLFELVSQGDAAAEREVAVTVLHAALERER